MCNNASNNDTIIAELSKLIENFPGAANQTRCFLHILNLVVKSIIKQFNLPKTRKGKFNDQLLELVRDLEDEELKERSCVNDDEDDNNTEGWIDEHELLSAAERERLDKCGTVEISVNEGL